MDRGELIICANGEVHYSRILKHISSYDQYGEHIVRERRSKDASHRYFHFESNSKRTGFTPIDKQTYMEYRARFLKLRRYNKSIRKLL